MTPYAIEIIDHLPEAFIDAAAELYYSALCEKLMPVYGKGGRARRALAEGFDTRSCLIALADGQLAGILGIQTAGAGFMSPDYDLLRAHYGWLGASWRLALLAFLNYEPLEGEAHIDGVAVSPALRGQGIGTRLIAALQDWAMEHQMVGISLEVIDTNPRAEKLYRQLGFEVVRDQSVWPLGSLFGFGSSRVMVKPLD